MEALSSTPKKKMNLDLPEETLQSLSLIAEANGKSLKNYIETILTNEANMLSEENVYLEFLKEPDSQYIISEEEKSNFEDWLEE